MEHEEHIVEHIIHFSGTYTEHTRTYWNIYGKCHYISWITSCTPWIIQYLPGFQGTPYFSGTRNISLHPC